MMTRGEICIELGKNVCRNCFHFDPPNEESALCLRYPPVWADGEWLFPEVQDSFSCGEWKPLLS